MRILKRTFSLLICILVTFSTLSQHKIRNINAKANELRQTPVIVDVVLYNFQDAFISLVKQSLENIEKQNEGKVNFRFYDSKGNQAIQDEIISTLVNDNADFLLVNLVDTRSTKDITRVFEQRKIPIIFFNREPADIDTIKFYGKSYYVGTNAIEAGTIQAQILINMWNNNRKALDTNNDGILQYIILRGQQNNIEAEERTKSVISTIEKAGIKTSELAQSIANWDRMLARDNISSLFLRYDNKIEAIIANNDEMAIGAIEALQKYGYNLGNPKKTIVVTGIDATPEAQELIKKGFMAGSVLQDPSEMAKAIYTIGLNVFQGNDPLSDTQYKFDDTGIAVRIPYREYLS
ncbi:galactose ABC transporter substrate-binding protein [Clostridium cibarium]|uniref:D-galactose/methyl-galactoside binding periplasmic protein MglB n=1 Tax=Clostridium cibarium TaxID=2762247 RepID=A0ABR8PTE3_9CLOT|nr:galactose ABC transporter substrate-binding protein [Clostridium cibarium]MBD7911448.1 galactose ABC transporter substrate-binding protein [Clostridium cibarium]